MKIRHFSWLSIFFLFMVHATDAQNESSQIYFKSGGHLDGTLVTESREGPRNYAVLRTASGGVLKLEKGKAIKRITGAKDELLQYNAMVKELGASSASHWKIYEWCRDKSRRGRFKDEALFHLRQIVKLDPSDDKAWRSFGLVDPDRKHISVNGKWVPEQQHYLSSGYVRVGSKWVSSLQTDANAQINARERLENDRKDRIKKWHKYVLPKEDVASVRAKLFDLVDPVSIPFIERNYLKKEDDPAIRALYLEAIGQVATPDSQRILIEFLMGDRHQEVREQAMSSLEHPDFDADVTSSMLTQFLRHNDNDVVNRAGRYIGRIGSEAAITRLIDALTTIHTEATGDSPDRMSTTFDKAGGTGLKMGGSPTKKVPYDNEGVLDALESITDQGFGYNRQLWRQWYVSRYSTINRNLRRSFDD